MIRVLYTLLSLAVAQAAPMDRPEKIRDSIYSFFDHVPGGSKLKCLLDDYTQIVDSTPNSAHPSLVNYGLVTYIHQHFEKQPPAVRRATKEFYDEANGILVRQGPSSVKSHAEEDEAPTLDERAGDANHPGLKPGWLWELALRHAKGDPNLASMMIAVCGHDDTEQGNEEVPVDSEEAHRTFQEWMGWLDGAVASLEGGASTTGPKACDDEVWKLDFLLHRSAEFKKKLDAIAACTDPAKTPGLISRLRQYRDELKPKMFETDPIFCPAGFPGELGFAPGFYLPDSLGKGVTIPGKLQKKIAEAQGPFACRDARGAAEKPGPASCLPAKYYHVYGGEFVACEMIARGHNPALVTELEAAMGWYYRAFWLGALAAGCDKAIIDDPGNPTSRNVSSWLDLLAELKHLGRKTTCSTSDLVDQLPYTRRKDCDQPTADAVFLIRQWTIFGKAGAPLGTLIPNLGENKVRDEDRPANWSDERIQLAKAKVRSIYSDFEWTMEQHRIGAKFAAEHCKPDPAKISAHACH